MRSNLDDYEKGAIRCEDRTYPNIKTAVRTVITLGFTSQLFRARKRLKCCLVSGCMLYY